MAAMSNALFYDIPGECVFSKGAKHNTTDLDNNGSMLSGNIMGSHQQHKQTTLPLQWRHNGRDDVSNHQRHDCLLNRLFRHRSKKMSKLRVSGFWAGNSTVNGDFPAQRASKAENVSIWWRHRDIFITDWPMEMQYFSAL